jgi:hypothetical protein
VPQAGVARGRARFEQIITWGIVFNRAAKGVMVLCEQQGAGTSPTLAQKCPKVCMGIQYYMMMMMMNLYVKLICTVD